ncbi:MAG: beta strand repeat-containing protein, partial [Planctomycetaceae bacterium]
MNTRFLQQLSGLFRSKSTRKQRTRDRSGQIQRLENRHLLTAPTLDVLYDLTIAEDSGERSVALTGITAGANEIQPLRVTATSSNTVVIANPSIDYNSPNSTGTLRFTPIANRWGNSIITVTVEDGGPDANLSTPADNESFTRTFRVAVTAVNDLPTLNPISDRTISEDTTQQTVALSGIGAGPFESQPLRVTATSSDTAIIPNPSVTYTGPAATGSIRFTPNANRFGTVTIIVSVEDGGLDSNFNTAADNLTFSRSFTVTVTGINDAPTFDAISDLTITEDPGEQSVSVTGISAGPFETQALLLTATSNNSSLIPNPTVEYTSPNSSAMLKFTPVANLFGTAVITVVLQDPGQDEDPNTTGDNLAFTRTFTVTVTSVNDAPTLDVIPNVTISEDDGEQVVNLTGITAGPLESQSLRVTATSSNTGLIPDPAVTYTSPDALGSLRFTPVADQSGSAVVTVTVADAGPDGDFNTTSDNASFQRTFTVTVNAVNDPPTLDALTDVSIDEDAAEQTVNLTGIFAGGGESQTLRVTASSTDTSLIPTPSVTYSSPSSTGSIRFTPALNQSGTAQITVTVEDPGADGDIDTAGDNGTVSRTFLVTVAAVNDAPTLDALTNLLVTRDAASQTVNLSGITAGGGETQPLQVTASSSNTALIPDPTVNYSSADPTGSISFTPVAGMSGSGVITVTVTDGGLDGDLSTTGDNSTATRTFTVFVNDPPVADAISDVTIAEDAAEQTVNLTGISGGNGEASQKVRITATSANTALISAVTVDYTLFASTGALRFTPSADRNGSSLITVSLEDAGIDGDFSTAEDNQSSTITFTVTVTPVNDAPTLNDPADLTIDEDAGEQTVNLTGISAGGGETQDLRVSASSNNTSLIAAVDVTYSSPQASGSLKFTPAGDANGTAVITVTVDDPGDDGTFGTSDDLSFSQSFTVTVNPVNDLPTITPVFDVTIDEDAPEQSVSLEGITAGGGETQNLRISASSDTPGLIPNPTVDYSSPNVTGTLRYLPVADQFGTAIITIRVEDAGPDGDFNTSGDNATFEITFSVTVNPVNDNPTLAAISDVTLDEDAPEHTVNLTGIFAGGGEVQPLQISVSSSNTALIPDPSVIYTSDNSTGSIKFTPVADQFGTVVVTVMVTDGGLDGMLNTVGDNASFTRTFTVTVNPVNDAPTIDEPTAPTVAEYAPEQTLTLTGITAGGDEAQPLDVRFSNSNAALFASISLTYSSPNSTADLLFTPAPETSGTATITFTVEDGGLDLDLSTTGDNATTVITVVITVTAVNDTPTIDPLYEFSVNEDSAETSLDFSGVTAGANESQPLMVVATSGDTNIVPNPTVTYTSANTTGSIHFQPLPNAHGPVEITVTVTDGGLDGDLSTPGDNGVTVQTFTLTVRPLNDAPSIAPIADVTVSEDAPEQTVNLVDISSGPLEFQPVRITATSDNPGLVPNPSIIYSTPDSTGTMKFQPLPDQSGSAVITVNVEDGGGDSKLETTDDNVIYSITFTITVTAVNDNPTLNSIGNVTIDEDAAEQTVSLTGISAGGGETQPLGIAATSSNSALIADPSIVYSSANPTGSLKFTPTANQSGSAIITVVVTDGGLDGDLSTTGDNASVTRTFTVTVNPVNDVPTLDQPSNVLIDEDAPEHTVNLTGITAGGGETQPISITATSDNTALIADPTVVYNSADSTGSLKFTPVANLSGSAVITVVVTDGGLDGNLSTAGDNLSVTLTFTVTVNPVNDTPTLDQPDDVTLDEDASEQTVSLTGIAAGGGEIQPLHITATSSNAAVIADPTVVYSSADPSGLLKFTPVADQSGLVVITVVVTDGGLDGDLSTTSDNSSVTLTFSVTVNPINDAPTLDQPDDVTIDEDAAEQTVSLTGITAGGGESQPLRITATSSNAALLADPTVVYSSADPSGSLKFTPVADQSGLVVITVVLTDGGLDGDLSTTEDNNSVTRTFSVTVNPVNDAPTLDQPEDVTIDEDAPEQTLNLTGITAGGGESQFLSITASSSNVALIPTPSVVYSSADATGSLKFTPAANQSGSVVITVVVTDAGLDGDPATTEDNLSVTRTFTITVNPVNDVPTLDQPDDVTIDEDAEEQTVVLNNFTAGGGEDQLLQITATSNNIELIPDPSVVLDDLFRPTLKFRPLADQSGSAIITVVVTDGGLDGDLSTTGDNASVTRTFTVTVNPVNDIPTLDQPDDVTIDEDAPEQTVNLTGIAAGGGESQPISITATSNNTALIADPTVVYNSADPTGSLKFTPVADQSGSAVITVFLTDGGLDNDLSTIDDNASIALTFSVTVNPVNDAPTLDQPDDLTIDEDAPEQTVSLTGITAGGGESQPISISATSSDATLIPDPAVVYSSADPTGSLKFTPVTNLSGSVVITVVVTDGGLDNDLSTTDDNGSLTLTFSVNVNPVNDDPTLDQPDDVTIDEDAAEQTVSLTGITAGGGEAQPLNITATSSNAAIIADPTVVYSSADPSGSLKFTPVADQSGLVVITVVVTDGGLDGDLSTTEDNNSVTRTFSVTVNPVNDAPTLDQPEDVTIDEDAPEQ